MMMTGTVRRCLFGAGTAVALGFGGAQALAAPTPQVRAEKVCDEQVCDLICDPTGRGGCGFCSSTGICFCCR